MKTEIRVLEAATVSQDEIRSLIGISNQIRTLGKLYDQRCHEVFERLVRGATVEPGIHVAELEESDEGLIRTTRLVLH